MRIKIKVTQECIDRANLERKNGAQRCYSCPVWFALCDRFKLNPIGLEPLFGVGMHCIFLTDKLHELLKTSAYYRPTFRMPIEVVNYIGDYDMKGTMKPFEFVTDIPEKVYRQLLKIRNASKTAQPSS